MEKNLLYCVKYLIDLCQHMNLFNWVCEGFFPTSGVPEPFLEGN